MRANECRVYFGGNENVLKLIMATDAKIMDSHNILKAIDSYTLNGRIV